MPVKFQQYYIFKLKTGRLKKKQFKINLSITEARKNAEIVSIGDSQLLRSLRKLKRDNHTQEDINNLFQERKNVKKNKSNKTLYEIEIEIDKLLFVPELISVCVESIAHYKHIGQHGFYVNGVHYVRGACSAGQARRNNALFFDERIEKDLKRVLNNDRNYDAEITPAKFNAYFSLSTSSTLSISTPIFAVVPDLEETRKELVNFVEEIDGQDDKVEVLEKDFVVNKWDGQGIISPRFAKQIAEELELDYVPSTFIVRANFIKGMLATFDYVEFSNQCENHFVTDVWGKVHNIRDLDCIISQSQFKLWESFESHSDYAKKCEKNDLGWGISRYSPKQENSYTFLNYQFCQALNLNDKQIEGLCSKTIEYFEKIINSDINYTLLYLLGKISDKEFDPDIFNKVSDNVTKALILNNNLINDPYIKNHIIHSLNKKIKESYIANLIVDGFYTTLVNDPYAQCQHILGLPVTGLLQRNEHYNKTWLDKGETKLVAMRAPLVDKSEVDVLNLKQNDDINYWYQYLNNCLIINIKGMDHAILGGSDVDGDVALVTNQKDILAGVQGGYPIHYETKKAPKQKIIEEQLYLADMKGFYNKVGFETNVGTSITALMNEFNKDSPEYKELERRVVQVRKEQGSIIDSTKGLDIKEFPKKWTTWTKIKESMTEEQKKQADFDNSLVVTQRPKFMAFLYSHYYKKWKKFNDNYNNFSLVNFGIELFDILDKFKNNKSNCSFEEIKFCNNYFKFNPLLDNDSVVNKICNYMQSKVKEIKLFPYNNTYDKNLLILKDKDILFDEDKLKKLFDLYKQYKSEKRNFANIRDEATGEEKYKTVEQYNKYIRQQALLISDNMSELANLSIAITYELFKNDNKSFTWDICGSGVIQNIIKNKQKELRVPFVDKNGDIEFLGKYYKNYIIDIPSEKEEYIFSDNFQ